MTRQEAIERLTVSLTGAIDKWSDTVSGNPEWEQMGWVGDDNARLMAKAAMAVLEYGASVQETLKNNGVDLDPDATV